MSQERWRDLSVSYGLYRDHITDESFRASRKAIIFRKQLEQYLGGPEGSVKLFDYDPEGERYKETDAFDAPSTHDYSKWFFAFGVTLERGPQTYPKTCFQFPVWISGDNPIDIDTSFGLSQAAGEAPDFTNACALIFEGLVTALKQKTERTRSGKKIGFLELP